MLFSPFILYYLSSSLFTSVCLRVAMNTGFFLQDQLGITSSTDRKKLQLRAMDLVLFGPPTCEGNLRQLFSNWLSTSCVVVYMPHNSFNALKEWGMDV